MSSRTSTKPGSRLVLLAGRPGGSSEPPAAGTVWLVGAGPGDPDLLTVRALRVISQADVIVHDGLVSQAILDLAPPAARRIDVTKRKSRHTYPQEEISRMLAAFALEGLTVVRLKGGDPFIFGRGGEELEACRAAGVDCRVVPGVTAGLAAAASAGAPLTHRGAAQSVMFVTGHAKAGEAPDLDWPALARTNQTVVVYMGLSNAAAIAQRLLDAGRAPATPALIVENASLPSETCRAATVGTLGDVAEGLSGPAVLVIGEAMSLARVEGDRVDAALIPAAALTSGARS